MNITIMENDQAVNINVLPITQLCGVNFEKKKYITDSISKYFSSAKYMSYEQKMIDNILVDGEKVGRQYFSVIRIQSREDIISMIQLSKNSALMKYLDICMNDFYCQTILDKISNELEQLYGKVNADFFSSIPNLNIGFEVNDIMKIIQNSTVRDTTDRDLHELSNCELLRTLFNLIDEINKKVPEKRLIIIDNIDHLIKYKDYTDIIVMLKNITDDSDICFLFSMSVDGFVYFSEDLMEGINVINTVSFLMPGYELLEDFVKNNYPIHINMECVELLELMKACVHQIGNEEHSCSLKNNIILKLINESLCIKSKCIDTINPIEMAFLNY